MTTSVRSDTDSMTPESNHSESKSLSSGKREKCDHLIEQYWHLSMHWRRHGGRNHSCVTDNILTKGLPSNDLRSIYILRSVGNLFNKVIYLQKSLVRVGTGTSSEQSCRSTDLYLQMWSNTAQKYSDVELSVTLTPCKVWRTIWNWQMLRKFSFVWYT